MEQEGKGRDIEMVTLQKGWSRKGGKRCRDGDTAEGMEQEGREESWRHRDGDTAERWSGPSCYLILHRHHGGHGTTQKVEGDQRHVVA